MVLRRQGQKCSVKETAIEWAQLDDVQKAKYHREADKVNALIAAANYRKPVKKPRNDEYDAHDSSELGDDDDVLEEEASDDSEVESVKRESHHAGKSDQRTSNVLPNDLRAVKAEPGDPLSSPEFFDPKEFRRTRKNYDLANLK